MDIETDRKLIIEALINDEIEFTKHGFQQMINRKLVRADLVNIGRTCVAFKWQDDKKTYFVAGYDTKGKGLENENGELQKIWWSRLRGG